MDADSDQALMAGTARGDREAFAKVYDRHAGVLLAIATRILGDRAEAESVLHDLFIEVWRAAREYDPGRGTVRAWLSMRIRSRALDRREPACALPRAANDAREAGAPIAEIHGERSGDALRRTLAGLPLEQRQVLELGFFDGLSSSEIADRIEAPLALVKSRVTGALDKLRRTLSPARPRGRVS